MELIPPFSPHFLIRVIKMFWAVVDETEYKRKRKIVFLINIPVYQFVIKVMGYLPGNKRRGTLRSKFLHPILVELEMMSNGTNLESLPSFEITEKEFVEWIGRISLDQVPTLEDIGWIMMVHTCI